jgi:hypothetical protein
MAGLLLAITFLKTSYDYFGIWITNPNVLSEFGSKNLQATNFALRQMAGGFLGPVYLSTPVTSNISSETDVNRYIVPGSLQPWIVKVRPFDGSSCLVLPAPDNYNALVVVPQGAATLEDLVPRLSGLKHTLLETGDFKAWRIDGRAEIEPEHALGYLFGDSVYLTGYDLASSVNSGAVITPTLYWKIKQPSDYALGLGVHLVDANREAIAKSDSRNLALDLRSAEERIISWLPVPVPEHLPSGRYGVLVTLYSLKDLQSLEVSTSRGAPAGKSVLISNFKVRGRGDDAVPARPIRAQFGDHIVLRGYTIGRLDNSSKQIRVLLHWEAIGNPDKNYTVSVQVMDSRQQIVAQHDGQPRAGAFPTSIWESGDTIADEHILNITEPAALNEATLSIIVYDGASLQRLPVRSPDAKQTREGTLVLEFPNPP